MFPILLNSIPWFRKGLRLKKENPSKNTTEKPAVTETTLLSEDETKKIKEDKPINDERLGMETSVFVSLV